MIEFISNNLEQLGEQFLEHIGLTALSLFLAVLLAVPLGILATRRQQLAGPLLGVAGVLQTIPSIALLGFLIPVLGIGIKPAILALFLYALLPILRNTYTGISGVDEAVTDAARGMGMQYHQILTQVQLPLALPVILAGIRTATVINVGVATLAAYIGAGGLGEFIFGGIALNNSNMILAGALPAALLAIIFDQGLGWFERARLRGVARLAPLLAIPLLASFYWLPQTMAPGVATALDPEFIGRQDGFAHLDSVYQNVRFRPVILNSGLMYEALRNGSVDAACGYSTDGRIRAYNLTVLEDDQRAFPPYFCAPLLNGNTYEQQPEAVAALEQLAGRLTDAVMTELNYQVDYAKRSPEAVAREYLEGEGLYRPPGARNGGTFTIGSKNFTEQFILTELFAMLIEGNTNLEVKRIPGLGGTKICFDALREGEIDCYAEYTGTAFLVLHDPTPAEVETMIDDKEAVYEYVKRAGAEQYDLRWLQPLGFNNTYAVLVRGATAEANGWKRVSDL